MTTQLRYRGRKPKHARDPLAIRPAERRAAMQPRFTLHFRRKSIERIMSRWGMRRNQRNLAVPEIQQTMVAAFARMTRLLAEYPIAEWIPVESTCVGFFWLNEFIHRAPATVEIREWPREKSLSAVLTDWRQKGYFGDADELRELDDDRPDSLAQIRSEFERREPDQ